MSISEQVKELRSWWEVYVGHNRGLAETLENAADTIESLSAKLQAENMERSGSGCNSNIFTEILENLDKRIGSQLKIMSGLNDETQRYGYAKALDAYQQIKTYIEITLEEHKEKRSAEDCGGGWISCKERLPEEKEMVIMSTCDSTTAGCVIDGTWYEADMFSYDAISRKVGVIAWKPLPKPCDYEP